MEIDETLKFQPVLQSHGSRILVVENHQDSMDLLSNLLAQEGYTVRAVADSQAVLTTVKLEKPDLILLDVNLPATDGYELCQQLKSTEDTQDVPVIFLGALDNPLDKARAFAVGGIDYITKPFQIDEVLVRIRNRLILHSQQQQLKWQNALLQQEIRERQQAQAALQQAEAKYRSIFENSTEGIFQTTVDGKYLSANPALAQIYGYDSPAELMAMVTNIDRQIYVQPKRRDELAAYLRQYGRISDAESQVYRKDGSMIWVTENIRVVRASDGTFLYFEGTVQDSTDRHRMDVELRKQQQQAERLLVSILPFRIAQRLKINPGRIADSFDEVTVLFADLVDFTAASAQISPTRLVNLLNGIFSSFDQLAERYGLEKIKTIGDAYMVAAGLPAPRPDHSAAIANMAIDMQKAIANFLREDGTPFQLRIGIHTGPVVAGVIGIKKFAYDLWGDTVNIASRMESAGEPGRIQVTDKIYQRLKDNFLFKERGVIPVKGQGEMLTYWLEGRREKP